MKAGVKKAESRGDSAADIAIPKTLKAEAFTQFWRGFILRIPGYDYPVSGDELRSRGWICVSNHGSEHCGLVGRRSIWFT